MSKDNKWQKCTAGEVIESLMRESERAKRIKEIVDNQPNFHKLKEEMAPVKFGLIQLMQGQMLQLMSMMDTAVAINDENLIEELRKLIEQLEFTLQAAWGLKHDANYHSWWLKPRSCTCPKMDNAEWFGYGKIIDLDCPIHKHVEGGKKSGKRTRRTARQSAKG